MSTRYDDDPTRGRSNTIAAIFATEKSARDAIKNLHKAGFKQTWLGKTREADPTTGAPTVEGGGDAFARFLSAGADRRPLHRALMERGLTESQARTVESDVAPGCLVITVYGEDNPQRVAEILADENGEVVTGDTPRAVQLASRDPRVGVEHHHHDDNGNGRGNGSAEQPGNERDETPSRTYDMTDTGRTSTQRGEYLEDTLPRDDEGYETEEFIAVGRGRDTIR